MQALKTDEATTRANTLDLRPPAAPTHDLPTLDQLVVHVQIGSLPQP